MEFDNIWTDLCDKTDGDYKVRLLHNSRFSSSPGIIYHTPTRQWAITTHNESMTALQERIDSNTLPFYDSALKALAVFYFMYPDAPRLTEAELTPKET